MVKKTSKAARRPIAVPVTVKESYDYLNKKNSNLGILVRHFDLKLEL